MNPTTKLKVYELAKELGQDSQHLVDVIQRLGIDIKNSMSVLGSEEVRTVRDHYRKLKPMARAAAPPVTKSPVTEKRVGSNVIRRRSKGSEPTEAAVSAAPEATAEVPSTAQIPASNSAAPRSAPVPQEPEPPEVEASDAPLEEEVSSAEAASAAASRMGEGESTPVTATPASTPAEPPPAQVVRPAAESQVTSPESKAAVKTAAPPAQTAAPTASAPKPPPKPVDPPKPRRFFPSIIKKVSTEEYLGEKVGPKVERKERPKEAPKTAATDAKSRTAARPGTGTATTGTGTGLRGPRRVNEIEIVPAVSTDAAKEAGKRRLAQRQDTVFKSADYLKREMVHATKKRKNVINRPAMKTQLTKPAEHKRVVEMGASISVSDLAKEIGVKATAIISKLMGLGVTASMNQAIDHDTASLVAHEFGYEVKQKVFKEEDFFPAVDLSEENLEPRAPVVTIMGHVDHGKTSLLDAIRKTKVAAGEAGGITQHVGAYTVQLPKGKITFIDTPGHEAFTAMRARGAKVTDIVIIVVSAVDGVMPQTIESISHSKAAGVPIIVALNKIDLPDANPDRVKQTLAGQGLNPEEWGGDTIYAPVSAKTGQGLDQLLENILLQAEMLELKANYKVPARGRVIESRLDKNKGPVASVLVQHGKLRPGDLVVCGPTYGKVRAMSNSFGQRVNEALPGDPVELLGLPEVPTTGDELFVVKDEKSAREITEARIQLMKDKAAETTKPRLSIEAMMAAGDGSEKELRVIMKADVQGSSEALREAFTKLPTDKVKLKVLHTGTGGISESDVMLAAASGAVILGFNIRPDIKAQKLAESENVEIRTYGIIYDMLEEVKLLLEGQLDKVVKERVIGRAEVREVFTVPKVGTIAGSAVIDGKVVRGCFLRLLRDSRVIYEGKISSLRRFKDDVKEVASGFECGIGLENFNDLKLGDQFEAYLKEESKGTL